MNQLSIPSHIVIFSDPGDDNEGLLADTMGLAAAQEVSAASTHGTRILRAARPAAARNAQGTAPDLLELELYDDLGVAGADLSQAQVTALKKNDRVVQILENIYRSPPRPTARKPAGLIPTSNMPLPPAFGLPSAGPLPADPLSSYILGMKAALDELARMVVVTGGGGLAPATLTGMGTDLSWPLRMIGLTGAAHEPTGRGVKVAVLDTGIDIDHPDLSGKITLGTSAVSFVPNETVDDTDGHGTHCAGVIAGPLIPATGPRYAVAPDVDLLVGKVLGPTGGYDSWILRGIAWAVAQKAQIISMSLGGAPSHLGYPEQYELAARRALDRGTLIVAAAGNDSQRPTHVRPVTVPANCPSIYAVGALGKDGRITTFSNEHVASYSGAEVDFVAPGADIYSTYSGGSYALLSGTSMATPHVAGLAALYRERFPDLAPMDLLATLKKACSPVAPAATYGSGLIRWG